MPKPHTLTLATLTAALTLTACSNNDDFNPDDYLLDDDMQELTVDTAQQTLDHINTTLHNPQATQQDIEEYTTSNYLVTLNEEYAGTTFEETRDNALARRDYWESDEVVSETVADVIPSGQMATSYRDREIEHHSYFLAPQTHTCSLVDHWVAEDGKWKLDYTDDSDCEIDVEAID